VPIVTITGNRPTINRNCRVAQLLR